MIAREQHFVTFDSPGTMFAEQSRKPIEQWDRAMAVKMARGIEERHGARPYGFRFTTCLVHDPIPDGRGGTLNVEEKKIANSGLHYLGGVVQNYDQIDANEKNRILRSNMRGNDWPFVVTNTNSWSVTRQFNTEDCIVGEHGEITERGDSPERAEYREQFKARYERWIADKCEGEF